MHWVPRCQVVNAGSLHLLTPCLWLILTRAYKKIEEDDLKFPLIFGEGKKVKHCARGGFLPAFTVLGDFHPFLVVLSSPVLSWEWSWR